jgi:cobalamin biosynthesis protein CobD/CbiB
MSNIIYNPEKQIDYRREGKLQRRELTDQIKNLVAFAKEHHSQNADWYYAAFGKLLKKQLNLPDT